MLTIDLRLDVERLRARLDDIARRQLPFAVAKALNATARQAVAAERQAMQADFDQPVPFTLRGVSFEPALKVDPVATVKILPLQARYLDPGIRGGLQVPWRGRRTIAEPVDLKTNRYGNIPKGTLTKLLSRPDTFAATITFRESGTAIAGIWQRAPAPRTRRGRGRALAENNPRGLKLLVEFKAPSPLPPRYRFGEATARTARQVFATELRRALAEAMRSARR